MANIVCPLVVLRKTDKILSKLGEGTFGRVLECWDRQMQQAPEVILGTGWSYPCDIWSAGCIIVELVTGEALFQTHENLEHLAMMERLLGPISPHIIKKADRRAEKYFRNGRELNWPEGAASRESIRAVRKLPRLRDLIMQCVEHSAGTLIDLLYSLLKFDPAQRLTAREALKHPFFREPSRCLR
ncbi:unnamed protein product [Closterium sp. Naga37s-1]|nr:unnamed protein product [Closterium sp. Naga37s-1]